MTIDESIVQLEYEDALRRSEYDLETYLYLSKQKNRYGSYSDQVWLDNCGDGKWYCDHCSQRSECGKRMLLN